MSRPLVLMYHRVADEALDYWGLSVSPTHFEEQLAVLRKTRRPLPLDDFIRGLAAGSLPSDAVALTFDDGYVDNLTAAAPRLAAADIPATVFVASGYTDAPGPFWWDELARLVLLGRRLTRIELSTPEGALSLGIDDAAARTDDAAQLRKAMLEAVYWPVRRAAETDRGALMGQLRSIFGGSEAAAPTSDRPMTGDEVRALARTGVATIGAHTLSHPDLPQLDMEARRHEILAGKARCEELAAVPVTAFAYPYGEFDAETRELVIEAGFAHACATRGGSPSDPFALKRAYIPDLDGDAFEARLRWASAQQEAA